MDARGEAGEASIARMSRRALPRELGYEELSHGESSGRSGRACGTGPVGEEPEREPSSGIFHSGRGTLGVR